MNKKKPELKYEELRELYDEAFIKLTDCRSAELMKII